MSNPVSLDVTLFAAELPEVADAAAGGGYLPIVAKLGVLAIEILTPVLMLLGSFAAYKLAGKFGIELGAAERTIVKGYIKQAINATDKWAKNQAEKPTSKDKLAKAVDYANTFIATSGLKKKGSDYLAGMVEAQLGGDDKTDTTNAAA